jgi:ribosomal protein L11 methyltransferase
VTPAGDRGPAVPGVVGAAITAWVLRTELPLEAVNLHLAVLETAGLLGLVEEHGRTAAYFPERIEGLAIDGTWEAVPDRDWHRAWREGVEPVRVGNLRIAPPWKAQAGDVVIEPAQAFGTGHHETTAGSLAALQDVELDGRRVLDVGTGSGVLAIAAARLGAHRVVAVDIDPEAVRAAAANAARNGVAIDIRAGSLEAAPEAFDVVIANLDTATLHDLASGLADRLTPAGTLVASGVARERLDDAVAALRGAGLQIQVRTGPEWAVLVARRSR